MRRGPESHKEICAVFQSHSGAGYSFLEPHLNVCIMRTCIKEPLCGMIKETYCLGGGLGL